MTTDQIQNIISKLTEKGIQFDVGLNEVEVSQVEARFSFKFPPDLKSFLQSALPITPKFVNWRLALKSKAEEDITRQRLNWPLEGMLFDIEHANFWVSSWGERPENLKERVLVAKKYFETYPKLIPIYSHRFIPCRPHEIDNPIFSVYQMDIIYYGIDLDHYFANEFGYTKSGRYELAEFPAKKIEFWSRVDEDEVSQPNRN